MVESRVERLLVSDDALRAVAVGLIALGIDERPAADEQRQVKQRLRLHRRALGSIKTYFVKKIGFHYKNWFFSALAWNAICCWSVVRSVGGGLCNDDAWIFNYTMDIRTLALTHGHGYLLLFPCFFFSTFLFITYAFFSCSFLWLSCFFASHIFTKRDNLLITLLARPSPPVSTSLRAFSLPVPCFCLN